MTSSLPALALCGVVVIASAIGAQSRATPTVEDLLRTAGDYIEDGAWV